MGLFSKLAPDLLNLGIGLLGSKKASKKAKPDWEDIERLIRMDMDANRTNIHGILGGWDWDDTKGTQTQFVDPAIQPGINSFMQRFAGGSEDPRLQELQAARFASMMNQPGIAPRPPARARPPTRERSIDEGPPPDWWRRQ